MQSISRRLRTEQAADYVGLAARTLEKMRLTTAGPRFFKIGRAVVYDSADLDEWLARQRRRSTAEPGQEGAGREYTPSEPCASQDGRDE